MRSAKPWFKIDESGVLWGMKLLVGVYRLFGRWLFAVLLHPVIAYYCKLAPLQWYNFYPFWRTPSKTLLQTLLQTLSQTSLKTCSSRGQR